MQQWVRFHTATVANRDVAVAPMARLSLRDGTGERILPTTYGENYLWLLPGETRRVDLAWPTSVRRRGPYKSGSKRTTRHGRLPAEPLVGSQASSARTVRISRLSQRSSEQGHSAHRITNATIGEEARLNPGELPDAHRFGDTTE